MSFPEKVPVKISSEAAGAISLTAVVRREMSAAELVAAIVGVTGKDAVRIREVLHQGVLVSGASRFRWTPIEAALEEIAPQLAAFPDPRPDRPFDPAKCKRAALSGGRAAIDLPRDAASRKNVLGRRSFWQALMEVASQTPPVYQIGRASCRERV